MNQNKSKEYAFDGTVEPYVQKVLEYINNGNAIDLGSGSGRDSLYLAQNGFSVTAVDNDEIHLQKLDQKNQNQGLSIKIVKCDIRDLKINDMFDIVVSNMVLHFFNENEIKALIGTMRRLTKSGGINVVVAYSDKNPAGKRPYLFKKNELKDLYAGWDILSYEEKPTEWFKLEGETELRRNHAVYLLARKPLN